MEGWGKRVRDGEKDVLESVPVSESIGIRFLSNNELCRTIITTI